jgi:hypothetical protein
MLTSARIASIQIELGLERPRVDFPSCVTEDEETFGLFLEWLNGELSCWHCGLTELEVAEILWWQEANNNILEAEAAELWWQEANDNILKAEAAELSSQET